MKICLLVTLLFLSSITAFSQRSVDPYIISNKEVYACAIENVYGRKMPAEFLIQADFADYPDQFMKDKLYLNVKKIIVSNNWKFPASLNKKLYRNLTLKSAYILDSASSKHSYLPADLKNFYLCSPVLESIDPNRVVIIFEESHYGQIANFVVCFLEKNKDNWHVVKSVVPFLF